MCGLAGFITFAAETRTDDLVFATGQMTDAMSHRGPDDSGVWVDPAAGIALGHRRLSIIDLSAEGHQPMASADGRLMMVFNGEIYNFAEIRRELDALGHRFRGHSDTEVMLAAFREWGVEVATKRFNGMFAFAVWDKETRKLTLSRDRMGKKPLYYGWCGNHFLFASDLNSVSAHPRFSADLDEGALALYLRHGYIPAPYSIYRGFAKLPPGTLLSLDASNFSRARAGAQPEPYWCARAAAEYGCANPLDVTPDEAVDELAGLLADAVGIRMIADVPLGAFLSGGIDSSLVVALMQARHSRPVKTFSIGFGEKQFNEAVHARHVAEHLGTDHTEWYVTPADALNAIPLMPAIFDEPFADSSQIPTFLVSQLARRHVTVSLSGDGGDELFAGYSAYFTNRRSWGRYSSVPWPLRMAGSQMLLTLKTDAWDALFTRLGPVMPSSLSRSNAGTRLHRLARVLKQRTAETAYRNLMSVWDEPGLLLNGAGEPPTPFTDRTRRASLPGFVERMMYLDTMTYLPDDILVKVDRASMAVSLESRCPLLDYRVYEFAWRLPVTMKIRDGRGKWPLRAILYRHVPPALVDRPKSGFAIPLGEWLRGPLRPWAEELLSHLRGSMLSEAPVMHAWKKHQEGVADLNESLWTVLMFLAWSTSRGRPGTPRERVHSVTTIENHAEYRAGR